MAATLGQFRYPLSFLFHCLICSPKQRDDITLYALTWPRILSIIAFITASNYQLIVVSEDKTVATYVQRIISSLFLDASHFVPPQTSEPTMAMTEGGADKGAKH